MLSLVACSTCSNSLATMIILIILLALGISGIVTLLILKFWVKRKKKLASKKKIKEQE